MGNPIFDSLFLVDASGHVIIASILLALVAGVVTNLGLHARYARIDRELAAKPAMKDGFAPGVLGRIIREAKETATRAPGSLNTQALVEESFQAELKGALLGERYVRSSTGLMIILGLVGTFYGLTASIGRLVHLITSEAPTDADVGQVLTQGLSQALSGMSVAFTTSLVGIVAAIVMMLFSIFSNVRDRRTALMVRIETYVDRLFPDASARGPSEQRMEQALAEFGQSVARLDEAVVRFDGALQTFSTTTRDFHEFNLHLKDNVQRMSLSFADLAETIRTEARATPGRDRG